MRWNALQKYSYNESFTTLIKAQYERSVPEFAEKFGTITQVAAVEKIREIIPNDAISRRLRRFSAGRSPKDVDLGQQIFLQHGIRLLLYGL